MTTTAPTLIELPLAQYPGIRPFALDLASGDERVAKLSSRRAIERLTPPAAAVDRAPIARSLAESNRRWGNDVDAELTRWASGKTVTIVGGQQVGFAGGPLLTLTKIASLLRLKRDLERAGTPATAMFWMATEDHDFGEVACLDWPRREGGLAAFRCPHPPSLTRPVGSHTIPEILLRHFQDITQRELPSWLRDGITFGDSFAELVSEVVSGRGLVLVDALDPELRRAGVPLFRQLASRMPEVEEAIALRSRELESAGFAPQVVPNQEGHYSVLYVIRGRDRRPLRPSGDGWLLGEDRVSSRDVASIVESEPERVSTGALARPLLQDLVLQPSIFVGGPAEVAYYSQILPLHSMLGIEAPHVALRGHVLVAPEKILRAMEKYDIAPPELVSPPEEILARRENEAMTDLHGEVARLAQMIDDALTPIRKTVSAADPTMDRSIARTLRRMRYHVGKIEERGGRAILRRDAERHRAIHRLCGTLFPGGVPQDRRSAWVGLWHSYRHALVDRLIDVIAPDSARFHITGV
jgi:bacillithiol biosynthesis cysteine-adding enzyme BshC